MNPSTNSYPTPMHYYGQPMDPSAHMGSNAHMFHDPMGSMQMVYGNNPMAYPGHMLPQAPYPMQPTQLLSPGAIARQQRASADEKRGKRRRGTATQDSAVVTGNEAVIQTQSQVVPNASGGVNQPAPPPIVKVKEERRKKRLLRNRVSAQQARERKRQHITELEDKCNKLEESNDDLESKIESLTKENEELRLIVRSNMKYKNSNTLVGGVSNPRFPPAGPDGSDGITSKIVRPRAEVGRLPPHLAASKESSYYNTSNDFNDSSNYSSDSLKDMRGIVDYRFSVDQTEEA